MKSEIEVIRETFTTYFGHLAQREHDLALDYLYPPLFKIISRKNLLSGMRNGVDKSVDTTLTELEIKNFSKEIKSGNVRYLVMDYQFLMTMAFTPGEPQPIQEEDAVYDKEISKLEFTYQMFKPKYGVNNMTINYETDVLTVRVNNQAYCISDPQYDGWKFLEKKDGVKELLEKLLKQNKK